MMDSKVAKDKNSRWVDLENLVMLHEIESKTKAKTKKLIDRGKRSKTLSEVKLKT